MLRRSNTLTPLPPRLDRMWELVQDPKSHLIESEGYRSLLQRESVPWSAQRGTSRKRNVPALIPPVLCVQLERGAWTAGVGAAKDRRWVVFPEQLCLGGGREALLQRLGHSSSSSSSSRASRSGERFEGQKRDGGVLETASAAAAGPAAAVGGWEAGRTALDEPLTQEPNYLLQSVVVHVGWASQTGHYICYRRLGGEGEGWVRISDEHVERVGMEEVLGAEVTLLCYEQQCR
jgi:hypothetical protein